jgi:hypothetical protein
MVTLNKVARLQAKSKGVVNIFEKAISRVVKINKEIAKAKETRRAKIATIEEAIQKVIAANAIKTDKITAEINNLIESEVSNERLASKLSSFLED